MYNHQLDAFIRVAQLGSFSKAAEAFYVTPSAMIQQINNLESDLGVTLFLRSKKGVRLTPAGEYLFKESQAFIVKSREIRNGVLNIQQMAQERICVGTNLLHKMRLFGPLWQDFKAQHPEGQLEIKDTTGRYKVMETDLVECVKDGEPWQHGLDFLQISTTEIAIAAPHGAHADRSVPLTLRDLQDKTVVTIHRGMSSELDRLGDALRAQGTRVLEVEMYDLSVFSMCEVNGYYLQIPACWSDLYGGMESLPFEWDYKLPYGFFYKPEPTGLLKAFLEFARTHGAGEKAGA